MPSVNSTVKSVKIGKNKYFTMESYWESYNGGIAMVNIMEHDENFEKIKPIWGKRVREWKDGSFTGSDVKKRFEKKFLNICKKAK